MSKLGVARIITDELVSNNHYTLFNRWSSMEKRQIKILEDFASDLKLSLNMTYLLPHLMKRKLLTTAEEHKLKNQAKTDHDNNSEFLDYLKTKGSRAFALFLAALRDETEHLGHADLCERMSQRAEQVGIRITLEALPTAMERSLSAEVGNQLIHHSHSMSEPATRRESLDSSVSSPIRSISAAKMIDESFTDKLSKLEKTQNHIMQQLDKIEQAVNENRMELEKLRKTVCDDLVLLIQSHIRPNSRDSRPGSSGMEGDCSSDGSEISLLSRNIHQKSRQSAHIHKPKRRPTWPWPTLVSQSDSSLHSTQEELEVTSTNDRDSILALSTTTTRVLPLLVPKQPQGKNVSLHAKQ